jgi:hypothetical protein
MKTFLFMCCLILAATLVQAHYIFVPSDYPSIQEGINSAGPGDIIIVSDGIYFERINFMGKKQLTLASEYLLDKDESHIANTIIDGSQLPYPTNRSLIYFILGEDTTTVLCGFTIRNGEGTLFTEDDKTVKSGGGIFISGSGAKIVHNRIIQNHLNYNPLGNDEVDIFRGGGIATEKMQSENWVILENNVIEQNTCISDESEASGGGISIWCNAIISGNDITHNTCRGFNHSTASAAGIFCGTDPAWEYDATVIMKNNNISCNLARSEANTAMYGGALLQHTIALVQGNHFVQNRIISGFFSGGTAGLGMWLPLEGSMVSENTFSRNISDKWCGALSIKSTQAEMGAFGVLVEKNYFLSNEADNGGGLVVYNVPVCMQNNVFCGNRAKSHGGAIIARRDYSMPSLYMIVMVNNSFYDNSAIYGGALYSVRSKANIVNSIFSNNYASMGSEFFIPYTKDTIRISHTNIDFSKIHGNTLDKGGNINEDPLFEDLNLLTLSNMSPCVDMGDAHYTCNFGFQRDCPLCDINNQTRMANGIADLGAHEFINDRSLTGLTEVTASLKHKVYPNPVIEEAIFEFELKNPCNVKITAFDNSGRNVAEVVNASQTKGVHKVIWNTRGLPSGMYFYRLDVSGQQLPVTGKIVIAR